MSGVPVTYDHIRAQGQDAGLGARLMAIVAEGDRSRIYLAPNRQHEAILQDLHVAWKPDLPLPANPRDFKTPNYGLPTFADLFTSRQLVALTTFSDLVGEAMEHVRRAAAATGLPDDGWSLRDEGTGATAYAEAVAVYLGFTVDKCADYWSSICSWHVSREVVRNTFGRQAIPMMWDYAEANPFCASTGNSMSMVDWTSKAISMFPAIGSGDAFQAIAQSLTLERAHIASADPPYYDNIGYADLSDFFYVWLRRTLRSVLPDLFSTIAVPKEAELVATPYRHGSRAEAEIFFMSGMTQAMKRIADQGHPEFPTTIYYAFKQSESRNAGGLARTGWETFLEAVITAGFSISGTWPMRTELGNRMIGTGANALASSVVLVCRKRPADAPVTTRRDFIAALKADLPPALTQLQRGNIAPVDLAQAAIGPGMAVYTRYARVLDATGKRVSVGDALSLINETLDEILAKQEGDFDADSRWALAWFEQYGFDDGDYGIAETLSKAKNTSVTGMVEAGILHSRAGKVRLLRPEELPAEWDPARDDRLTTWEMVHHLIRVLVQGGESGAAGLVRKLGGFAEVARELCYRLYTVCERKKRATEALAYNGLVRSWPEISRLAAMEVGVKQPDLFADGGKEAT